MDASPTDSSSPAMTNVGLRLSEIARQMPDAVAVAMPTLRAADGSRQYRSVTFRELDEDTDRIAAGLRQLGMQPGMRIVLMVRPSIDFIALVFAMFKARLVTVLIDPGMGRRNLIRCLADCQVDGFIAIPMAHAMRTFLRGRFPQARFHVTVGRRWFWGGTTLDQIRSQNGAPFEPSTTAADDPAAIIFTTGSTGPPKGVLYRHGNFNRQVDELRDHYQIAPGEVDLPGFPLFALFNAAMGVTTIVPDMDPTRPAKVDPSNIVEAIRDWKVTQAFGSPALWNVVGRYCESKQIKLSTLKRVLSAGAPVPPHVLLRMKEAIATEGDVHTPYGATESLPVASIAASEVLSETASYTNIGAGTCVGRRFAGIEWKVIRIGDQPIATLAEAEELPRGEIGELIVTGDVVTREYFTRPESNALHKVRDGERIWHRIGDVGYFDEKERFWFCGRKSHRLQTAHGPMYTVPCEAVINSHPHVYRSALVGLGPAGSQRPVIVVETWPEHRPSDQRQRRELLEELKQLALKFDVTKEIHHFLLHPGLPVDIRHNAKIFREKLVPWAAKRLGRMM
jgi:olefin beta-lactone synthetase